VVVHDCVIAGKPLSAGAEFTFDVSAKGMAEGGTFRRRILTGTFTAIHELDYGNPVSG
jgi:hypothetical protein